MDLIPVSQDQRPTDDGEALQLRDRAIAASSNGIVISDARQEDMPLIYINPAFERLSGYTAAEVLGRNCRFLQGDDRDQPALTILRAALHEGRDCTVVLRNYRKDGQLFWNELHMSPVHDGSGLLTHFVGVQTDITRRKQAEDDLQKAKDELEVRVTERTRELESANRQLRAELAAREEAEAQVRRQAEHAEALAHMAARLSAQLDLETVAQTACEEIARALEAPVVLLSLYDERQAVFKLAAAYGLPPELQQTASPFPRALYNEFVPAPGSLVSVPDLQALPSLPDQELYTRLNLRSCLVARLAREEKLIGTLTILTLNDVRIFPGAELALLEAAAYQVAQAIANAQLFASAEQRLQHTQALRNIELAITGSVELRLTLKIILEQVTSELQVDAADILLLEPTTETLEYAAGSGFISPQIRQTRRRVGEGQAGRAALTQRTVHIPDLSQASPRLARTALLTQDKFIAYFALPLLAKGQLKGVLEIFHRAPLDAEPEWLEFMEALGGQAAIAIDNATLFTDLQHSNIELRQAYETTIEGWSAALDLRDKETEGHTQRVTELALRLGRQLGFSNEALIQMRRGALLHDIGKMGVPDQILLKPGKLTDEEFAIMQKHPGFAYDLLSPISYLRPALDIPYCHHEKWDGTGYPRGLKGEQIPLAARLFAVVDVWDALCSDRPYRQGWPLEKVRTHIRGLAGSHFDPQAVDAFMALD
jgi:PAS domain S-box-containing protein